MAKKASAQRIRRSPYLCCDGVYYSSFTKTVVLSVILVLCVVFVILVLIAALYAGGGAVFLYAIAAVMLSAAAMLAIFYILCLSRKNTFLHMEFPPKMPLNKTEISTVCGSDYYSQVPAGRKSDFPMGPNLIMTLPKTSGERGRCNTWGTDGSNSTPNTPRQAKKKPARRSKNVPPLASMETLTPSLVSSYGSIDSVV